MKKLERSPELQEKIDTIRALPQGIILSDTPENRQKMEEADGTGMLYGIRDLDSGNEIRRLNEEKRLEAKLLRQEIMWGTAELIKKSFDIIKDTPDITSDELFEQCVDSKYILNPATLSKFHEILAEKAEKNRQFYENIVYYSAQRRIPPEVFLFQVLIPEENLKGRKRSTVFPKSPGKLSFHPLAVQIQFSEEDFALVDTQQNTGGFYRPINTISSPDGIINFSGALIAVKNTPSEKDLLIIYNHEEGHAFQDIINTSMESVTDEELRRRNDRFYETLGKTYSRLLQAQTIEELEELYKTDKVVQDGIKEMLHVYETWAADEILADKNANRPMYYYLKALLTYDEYDYVNYTLTTYLNRDRTDSDSPEKPNPLVKSFLKEIYYGDLIEKTKTAKNMDNYYSGLSPHRSLLFREALRVIPIDQWDSFLTETMCVAEAETWQKIQNDLWEILVDNSVFNKITDNRYPLSEEAKKFRNDCNRLKVVARETVNAAKISPIYKQLEEIAEQASELAQNIVDLPEYNTMVMCLFVDRVKDYVSPDRMEEYEQLQKQFGMEVIANPGNQEVLNKYKKIFNEKFVFEQSERQNSPTY